MSTQIHIAGLLVLAAAITGCNRLPTVVTQASGSIPDPSPRIVEVNDLGNRNEIERVRRELVRLSAEQEGEPIHVEINSTGGLVGETLDLAATMRALPSPVHTHTRTGAHAIAAVLIVAGTPGHRSADPSAQFGFVGVLNPPPPSHLDVKIRAMMLERLTRIIEDEAADLDKILNSNRSYSAEEALEVGLIDRITH